MSLGNDGGIPAVMNVTPTGTISSGSGGMGWGNDGSWWIIIFLDYLNIYILFLLNIKLDFN